MSAVSLDKLHLQILTVVPIMGMWWLPNIQAHHLTKIRINAQRALWWATPQYILPIVSTAVILLPEIMQEAFSQAKRLQPMLWLPTAIIRATWMPPKVITSELWWEPFVQQKTPQMKRHVLPTAMPTPTSYLMNWILSLWMMNNRGVAAR